VAKPVSKDAIIAISSIVIFSPPMLPK